MKNKELLKENFLKNFTEYHKNLNNDMKDAIKKLNIIKKLNDDKSATYKEVLNTMMTSAKLQGKKEAADEIAKIFFNLD